MQINPIKAVGIFILVALFLCYEMAVQVSPGIITQQLIHDLKINALGLGLISGFYFYSYTIMQIPAGLLYDRFNVRLVILLPLLACVVGTFLFGISSSAVEAALARLLMGAGSAFAFIGVLVVAADVFPKKHFALLAGIAQMLAAIGAMGGELPLVPVIHYFGWRHAMMFIASIGLILVLLIWAFVRYKKVACDLSHNEHLNIVKSLKFILRNSQTWYIAIYACLLWAPMSAFASLWGVPYLIRSFHLSHSSAAALISFMWVGLAISSPLVGWWSDFITRRKLPLTLCALVGFISFSLVLLANHIPNWSVGLLILLAGAACAGQALSFALVRDNNLAENRAAAIGFNNMAVVISGALFQPLVGQLIQSHWSGTLIHGSPIYSAADYTHGLLLLPAAYLIAFLVSAFLLKESGCSSNKKV